MIRRLARTRPPLRPAPSAVEQPDFLIEQIDRVLLLREPADTTLQPSDLVELAHTLEGRPQAATVVVAGASRPGPGLWHALAEAVDQSCRMGATDLTLALPDAGRSGDEGEPALAQRIADRWRVRVTAPQGQVVFIPGGSLFVPGHTARDGWSVFTPADVPQRLGLRVPAPRWQGTFDALPARLPDGCRVDRIPAGVVVRASGARPPRPGDLHHAIPVDPQRPAVLVGVVEGEDVAAADVGALLSAVTDPALRGRVRLMPGGGQDILPLGQELADRLSTPLEVCSGLMLTTGSAGGSRVRAVVTDAQGVPRWHPYLESVICLPADGRTQAPPRPARWHTPVPGAADATTGAVPLTGRWQVTVTRNGLAITTRGRAVTSTEGRISPTGPVLQIGLPDEQADNDLWVALTRVLRHMSPGQRALCTLHLEARTADGGRELRRLAAAHQVRGIRYGATAALPALPAPPASALPAPAVMVPAPPPQAPRAASNRSAAAATATGSAPTSPLMAPVVHPVQALAPVPAPPETAAADRADFRAMIPEGLWGELAAASKRTLDRMPGLTGPRAEDALTDLIAVRLYLSSAPEAAFGHHELVRRLRAADPQFRAYESCLRAGLHLLPPYRDVVVRSDTGPAVGPPPRPGAVLREPGPLCGVPLDEGQAAPPGVLHVLWSRTGTRVQRSSTSSPDSDEVVFAPGTPFLVLDVLRDQETGEAVLLLDEMPQGPLPPGQLSPQAVTQRLRAALARRAAPGSVFAWPPRCVGDIPSGPTTAAAAPPTPGPPTGPHTQTPLERLQAGARAAADQPLTDPPEPKDA